MSPTALLSERAAASKSVAVVVPIPPPFQVSNRKLRTAPSTEAARACARQRRHSARRPPGAPSTFISDIVPRPFLDWITHFTEGSTHSNSRPHHPVGGRPVCVHSTSDQLTFEPRLSVHQRTSASAATRASNGRCCRVGEVALGDPDLVPGWWARNSSMSEPLFGSCRRPVRRWLRCARRWSRQPARRYGTVGRALWQ